MRCRRGDGFAAFDTAIFEDEIMTGHEQAILRSPGNTVRRLTQSDVAVAFLVCLPLAVLYCAGVEPTVGGGDSAEFVTAAYTLLLPHPPGYPIYTVLGRLCCPFPAGTVPLKVNLLSAACAFLALVVVFLIAAKETRSLAGAKTAPLAAGVIAIALVGVSPSFWRYAVVAEAYAINALAVMLFAYLLLAWLRKARPNLLLGASLALGFAVGTHLSTIFLIPVLVGAVLLKARSLRALLWSAGFFAVGASQYVFVIVRAKRASDALLPQAGLFGSAPAAAQGSDRLVKGIWYITGGPWRDSHPRSFETLMSKSEELGRWLRMEYPAAILVLALAAMVLVFLFGSRRLRPGGEADRGAQPGSERHAGARSRWAVLASVALSQAAFYIYYRPSQVGMVLPLVACIGIFAAAGLVVVGGLAARSLPPRSRAAGSAVIAVAIMAAVVAWSGLRAGAVHPRADGSALLISQAIGRLPAGSCLAGVDYKHSMIINYYRVVEKRDVQFKWGAVVEGDRIEDLATAGAYFVLGTPRSLLRFGRAGAEVEPYLTVENAPTIYRVKVTESIREEGAKRLRPRTKRRGGE